MLKISSEIKNTKRFGKQFKMKFKKLGLDIKRVAIDSMINSSSHGKKQNRNIQA
jgi:hypothetical protein